MAVLVVPARYGAKRLPGKPLLAETGKPLVVHVLERAAAAASVHRALVATDDERIREAVEAHGGEAVMTSAECSCGTERVAEVARSLPDEDLFVNLQGDEPEIEPESIDLLVEALSGPVEMATLAAPLREEEEFRNPAVVKVVVDGNGDALYFSRAPIPFARDGAGPALPLHHLGIYGFRRKPLMGYLEWPSTPLERTEKLEQLRALENGVSIRVIRVASAPPGIDDPESYRAFVSRWRGREAS